MDNSDDYFDDSFVLDDNVLEVLQQAETKLAVDATSSSSTIGPLAARAARTSSPPPAKRQKTAFRVESSSDDDETPDVIVREDGTYNLISRESPLPRVGAVAAARGNQQAPQPNRQSINRQDKVQEVQRASARAPTPRNAQRPTNNASPNGISPHVAQSSSYKAPAEDGDLRDEVAKLRAQIEKLNSSHLKTEAALKEAKDAQYAREGEVKILRQMAAKNAEEHAAEVEKLQATKAAVEAKQVQLEKEQKAALERMRTQLTFNQLEAQASARKPPGSARSKTPRHIQVQSPLPLPANMRAWNATASGSQGVTSTPLKSRKNGEQSRSPSKTGPGNVVPKLTFRGFENSFMQSTPLKSPTRRARQPSGLSVDAGFEGTPRLSSQAGPSRQRENSISPSKRSPSKRHAAVGRLPPKDDFIQDFDMDISHSTPQRRRGSSPSVDFGDMRSIIGSDVNDVAVDSDKEELDDEGFDGLDLREEFHRVLFSYVSPPSKIVSFQTLLSTRILEDADATLSYQSHCSAILNALADKFQFNSLKDLMATVASSIVDMAEILLNYKILSSLQNLVDLLRCIVLCMPVFITSLLQEDQKGDEKPSKFVVLLCNLLKTSREVLLQDTDSDIRSAWELLVRMTLHFLSTMIWVSPDDQVSKWSILARTDHLLTSLFDDSRDSDTVLKATHLLVVSASHPSLTSFFVSLPDIDVELAEDRPRDLRRIPLVERLNTVISDCTPSSTKNDIIRSILDFYTLLVINNTDGRDILLKSNTIVPSIVRYLHDLSTQLYEDDERVTSSPEAALTAVDSLTHALRLLHLLVFTDSPPSNSQTQSQATNVTYNLRYALYHAPHIHFNGVAHMFMVMIGRLSCADPPDWLEQPLQMKIDRLTDPARDLMGLVIEGPEIETVWAAYQGEDDSVDNENEVHAQHA